MSDIEKRDSNTTMMALAALMFFSPFIHYMLRNWAIASQEQEKNFVLGYVKLGYINRIFLLATITSGVGNYFITSSFLSVVYAICIGIVLIILLVGSICILSNVSLTIQKDFSITFYDVGDKQDLILKFLPLYNVYLRYKLHNFWAPNRWVKESLLWRTFFVLLALTGHPLILSVIIVLRILRVATLMAGLDVLHIQAKSDINNLFFKNPEEIRWYFSGGILFLWKGIQKAWNKTLPIFTLQSCIDQEKEEYSRLYNISQSWEIWVEYLIGAGLAFLYRYFFRPDFTLRNNYIPLALICGRYFLMVVIWQHLPHIPLAREILMIISAPIRLLINKHTDVQK